jgi:tripartite-type tricarboxylate transporter receptor subunit TctC
MLTRRALLAASLAPLAAHAQSFPSKPIKLIIPYAAGGGTDAIARLVANGLSEALNGHSVLVENNGGGGGNIASGLAAKSDPDGHTILMANQGPMVVNPSLFKNMSVNPLTDFDPITQVAEAPLVLVTPANSPYKTIKELLDFLVANPDKLTYGSAGNGSASHLATALMLFYAKAKALHIPYRGAAPAMNDLIGARTDFMITTLPSVQGQVEGGLLKALAVTSKERAPKYPHLPTIAESGFPDYVAKTWYGFVLPKGTPKAINERLRQATIKALNKPALKERLESEGAVIVGGTGEQFATLMREETALWAKVIPALGLRLD